MVDPTSYDKWTDVEQRSGRLDDDIQQTSRPLKICSCDKCEEQMYQHAVKSKFIGYEEINPLETEELTEHQSFICDNMVECFLFKTRSWGEFTIPPVLLPNDFNLVNLHIDGIKQASFNMSLFDRLVMKEETKQLIMDLTRMYIRDGEGGTDDGGGVKSIAQVHKKASEKKVDKIWSADAIRGKGEGLTMLLHGRPGVGKTYTAGSPLHVHRYDTC